MGFTDTNASKTIVIQRDCEYCGTVYAYRAALDGKRKRPKATQAAGDRMVALERYCRSQEGLDGSNVLCPSCKKFASSALQRHYPEGLRAALRHDSRKWVWRSAGFIIYVIFFGVCFIGWSVFLYRRAMRPIDDTVTDIVYFTLAVLALYAVLRWAIQRRYPHSLSPHDDILDGLTDDEVYALAVETYASRRRAPVGEDRVQTENPFGPDVKTFSDWPVAWKKRRDTAGAEDEKGGDSTTPTALQDAASAQESYKHAVRLAQQKRYDLAIKELKRAIDRGASDVRLFKLRGRLHAKTDRHDAAVQDYASVLAIDPDDAETYRLRAKSHSRLRQYAKATRDVEKAKALEREQGPTKADIPTPVPRVTTKQARPAKVSSRPKPPEKGTLVPLQAQVTLSTEAVCTVIVTEDGRAMAHVDGTWQPFRVSAGVPSALKSVLIDRAGRCWLGGRDGVTCYQDGRVKTYGPADGLPAATISRVFESHDGTIWVSSYGDHIACFRDDNWCKLTTSDGLRFNDVNGFALDAANRLWIGTDLGVSIWQEGRFVQNDVVRQLAILNVKSITNDASGRVYLGYIGGLGIVHADETIKHITCDDGLPQRTPQAVFVDRSGRIWLGTWGGGLARVEPGPLEINLPSIFPDAGCVGTLSEDPAGVLYAASLTSGLWSLPPHESHWKHVDTPPGMDSLRLVAHLPRRVAQECQG